MKLYIMWKEPHPTVFDAWHAQTNRMDFCILKRPWTSLKITLLQLSSRPK